MFLRTIVTTTAVLVAGFAASAATPSLAAHRHHAGEAARQYEGLAQRDAAPAVFQQVQRQPRTINAWGHTFTVD